MEYVFILAILWVGFVLSSMSCGTFLVSFPAYDIARGVSASKLKVDAVVRGLLVYGGISALLGWLLEEWVGLVVGVAVGLFCAFRMRAAIVLAEQMARSEKSREVYTGSASGVPNPHGS